LNVSLEWLETIYQASRSDAPIVVCAPHATLVDALTVFYCDAVPLVKAELAKNWIAGSIAKFLQVGVVDLGESSFPVW
jgi:1-acyl-sn-glycerol-3-phosphate acyltransferase